MLSFAGFHNQCFWGKFKVKYKDINIVDYLTSGARRVD